MFSAVVKVFKTTTTAIVTDNIKTYKISLHIYLIYIFICYTIVYQVLFQDLILWYF